MSDTAPTTAAAPDPAPTGPVLSYNVPQDVSYSGQSFIELQLDSRFFLASSRTSRKGESA